MVKSQNRLLIIFYRNPRLGHVKTRLAATMGEEKALAIYQRLACHTREVTRGLMTQKMVFYSDHIEPAGIWPDSIYRKAVQSGADLGERMKNAVAAGFRNGYDAICIVGTDCLELTPEIIDEAFLSLRNSDAVIGPAMDGGYYLLGMRKLHEQLFKDKRWSTETVCRETIQDFEALDLSYAKLQTLRDVDTEDDLPEDWKKLQ